MHITRAALVDAENRRSATGTHLAVYVEPDGAYSPTAYLAGTATVSRVFLPFVFDRWPGLRSFDVCQEPRRVARQPCGGAARNASVRAPRAASAQSTGSMPTSPSCSRRMFALRRKPATRSRSSSRCSSPSICGPFPSSRTRSTRPQLTCRRSPRRPPSTAEASTAEHRRHACRSMAPVSSSPARRRESERRSPSYSPNVGQPSA